MSVRKASVVFVPVGLLVAVGSAARADYEDEVLNDEPFAYWRLGEAKGRFAREESGNNRINGTYRGEVKLGEDGLIFGDFDTAVAFNGFDAEVRIPDSPLINTGGPDGRSLLVSTKGLVDGPGLYTVDVRAGATTFIRAVNGQTRGPDGRSIYFRDWPDRLVRLDLESRDEQELYQGEIGSYLAISPDGQRLASYHPGGSV